MNYQILNKCLCCGEIGLKQVLDLHHQPPANHYRTQLNEPLDTYPLGLNVCTQCWHAQLTVSVDRRHIFDHYHYASGTSQTLVRYFAWFAQALQQCLPKHGRVLELAANDGSFMQALMTCGVEVVGLDPAENIVQQANQKGIPVKQGYWPQAASEIDGLFDAIVCMNVLAHVDDPAAFLAGCTHKLRDTGFLLIQPSQARMFENMEFDTCYHEHISFFNTNSMSQLANRCGLELIGAWMVKIHGDSPVYLLAKPNANLNPTAIQNTFATGDFAITEDKDLFSYEKRINLFDWVTYDHFEMKAQNVMKTLREVIQTHRAQGYRIVFIGAAAKAMTVINAAGVEPDGFYDEATLKIGKYPPGLNVPIEPLSACAQLSQKTLFVITAWNFKDELIQKMKRYGIPSESKFFTYFPQADLVSSLS